MSSALQVVAARQYDPIILYGACPTSPISNWFDIPEGYHAVVKVYDAPAGWCFEFEEGVCICCCDIEWYPVPGACCGAAAIGLTQNKIDGEICLPAGRYRASATDEFGDPVVPGPREAVLKVSIMPGPCPTTV